MNNLPRQYYAAYINDGQQPENDWLFSCVMRSIHFHVHAGTWNVMGIVIAIIVSTIHLASQRWYTWAHKLHNHHFVCMIIDWSKIRQGSCNGHFHACYLVADSPAITTIHEHLHDILHSFVISASIPLTAVSKILHHTHPLFPQPLYVESWAHSFPRSLEETLLQSKNGIHFMVNMLVESFQL